MKISSFFTLLLVLTLVGPINGMAVGEPTTPVLKKEWEMVTRYYEDADFDGYGNPYSYIDSSNQMIGYVTNNQDCDDTNRMINPGASEVQDGVDNDCDGLIDEGFAAPDSPEINDVTITNYCGYTRLTRGTPPSGVTWYWQSSATGTSTSSSATYVNRYSGNVYYLRARNSSGTWSDTSLTINFSINVKSYFYADSDGDGLGDPNSSQYTCSQPTGYVANNEDQCPSTAGAYSGCPTPTTFTNMNYVRTRTYQRDLTNESGISDRKDIREDITYLDGLGRPVQNIVMEGSPNFADMVTHNEYDTYGRQVKQYLPYPDADGNPGVFQTNAASQTNSFYWNKFGSEEFSGSTTTNAFSETSLESSPLNRTLKQAAPGAAWKMGGGHEIEYDYLTNASSEVKLYKVTLVLSNGIYEPTLVLSGSYAAGELTKTVTYDENNNYKAKAHSTEEFKDKQGRIVLKRTYKGTTAYDTYYVYDDYGNLNFVLPPKSEPQSAQPNATELSELCYQYKYDKRNRLVEKKLPGKGLEYIVYNKLDQPVLTQDQVLKAQSKWLLTKYDAFGRVAYTGYISSGNSRYQYQTSLDGSTIQYESRGPALSFGGTSVNYTKNAQPNTATEIYTINYYDDYNVSIGFSIPASNTYGETIVSGTTTKGLATVTKIKVLGTSQWIITAMGYDDKGRVIWAKTSNPFLGSTQTVESKLDFIGNVLESKTTHQKTGKSDIVLRDYYTYDHMNRLKTHTQSVNGGSQEMIAENTYDELGQLVGKGVGNTDGNSRLQDIAYTYNVRGWLKTINDIGNINKLFNFKLSYNNPSSGTALYNGNISRADWRTDNNDSNLKYYRYYYDDLNRITSATANSSNYNVSGITYDKNGNILSLTRNGAINSGATSFGSMDVLSYGYNSYSNRLKTVNDSGNDTYGFKDGSSTTTQYSYDTNGNLTSDLNKGIAAGGIEYNHLNMPTKITVSNAGSNNGVIDYVYAADGIKLQKKKTQGGITTTTDYAGDFVYENNTLKQFYQPEGYVEPDGSGWQYVYQYRDIWGNTRITYADDNNSGSVTSAEIRREQNYYPFGLEHKGYNIASYGAKNNLKTYQGQEFTEDLGLNTHEWKYRMSDPAIGRFWQIDPLAEDYTYNSTYAFQENKLGSGIELEGLENVNWEDFGTGYNRTVQNFNNNFYSNVSSFLRGNPVTESLNLAQNTATNVAQTAADLTGVSNALGLENQTQQSIEGAVHTVQQLSNMSDDQKGAVFAGALIFTMEALVEKKLPLGTKPLKNQALDLKDNLNGGKNSVTIKTGNGQIRYDLDGKAHGGVDTPHKQSYQNNMVNGEVKNVSRTSKKAETMTQQDIRTVRKTLEKRKETEN